ncbi:MULTISPECIES: hypothetical protein [unclassified Campylobacter]|uniref:hypothetical protein n=1 Tax=unclassified Campylobacter TaxID=2593542 RepID=UPI0014759078|nr:MULTISPECIES: hypothetical protein [unclassified Campylobacter]
MKNLLIFLALVVAFFGCSSKVVVHEPLKNELLAYTSKSEIIQKDLKILVLGTYLNPVHSELIKESKDEKFIIALYPKDSEVNFKSFSVNNDISGIKARVLDENDELLKLITFQMPWGKYIEVSAPEKISDKLNLSFEIYPSKQVSLEFQKVSKSMYWN